MAAATLPAAIEEWTQEQRDSLLVIAKRTLAGYGKYSFSREFIARHVDDFVQDALLQAWVSQQDPEAEALRIYNPAGFVSFKVVQLALDRAKGEKLRLDRAAPEGTGVDEQGAFQTAAERISDPIRTDEVHELVEQLQATKLAMAQLPQRQRVAFVKCQLEGRSQDEVAKDLSETSPKPVTRKAVERLVANARVSLSAAFSKVASGAFCEEQRRLLDLVEKGWATPEQAQEAHAHLRDCSQCAQVRAFARFERNAGLAAITLPGLSVSHDAPATAVGLFGSVQHLAATIGERARDLAARVWPFGGTEAGGAAVGTVTTTKAVIAICVAAGGTGACTKMLSPAPRDAKPSLYKEQSSQRGATAQESAPVPAVGAEPAIEATVSPSPAAEVRSAHSEAGKSRPNASHRLISSQSAPSGSSSSSRQASPQEFGFEGTPSSSAGSGSSSGGPPNATSSAVSRSTAISDSGASATPAPSTTVSSGGGSSVNQTSGSAGSGGGGSSASQAQGEFGLSP